MKAQRLYIEHMITAELFTGAQGSIGLVLRSRIRRARASIYQRADAHATTQVSKLSDHGLTRLDGSCSCYMLQAGHTISIAVEYRISVSRQGADGGK